MLGEAGRDVGSGIFSGAIGLFDDIIHLIKYITFHVNLSGGFFVLMGA
jgi:hypothetical protein